MKLDIVKKMTTDVDAGPVLNIQEPAIFTLKHYSKQIQHQATEVILSNSEQIKDKDGLIDTRFKPTAEAQNKMMKLRLMGGVVKSPFDEPWDEKTIEKIMEDIPQLADWLVEKIEEFNTPLTKVSA